MELITTEDGSPSLRDKETGELFHNRAGAFTEALVNYVSPSAALERLELSSHLFVLDVCFGMGYNSFVLIEEALARGLRGKIQIHAIEIDSSVLAVLSSVLKYEKFKLLAPLLDLNALCSQQFVQFDANGLKVAITMEIASLRMSLPELKDDFDIVFHDPFSPKRVPELWTVDIFREYQRLLKRREGVILTYSSAAAVRGGLLEAGFVLKRTHSLGGKTGGTIGFVSQLEGQRFPSDLADLNEPELEKIRSLSGVPYRDCGLSLERKAILLKRQEEQALRRARD